MVDADGKMRIENADGKNADNKKSKGKKRKMWMAKKKNNINKHTIMERNLSFKSLSHGWAHVFKPYRLYM